MNKCAGLHSEVSHSRIFEHLEGMKETEIFSDFDNSLYDLANLFRRHGLFQTLYAGISFDINEKLTIIVEENNAAVSKSGQRRLIFLFRLSWSIWKRTQLCEMYSRVLQCIRNL